METRRKAHVKLRKGAHILRTLKCKYCRRNFYGSVRIFKQHVRNHEKKYYKHWAERTITDNSVIKGINETSDQKMSNRLSDKEQMKKRLYVYIVYAPVKNLCDCDKENKLSKMPCECDFMFKKMVYSSITQMHHGMSGAVSYKCDACKTMVFPKQMHTGITEKVACNKCKEIFVTEDDLDMHQQVCLGYKEVLPRQLRSGATEVVTCTKCNDSFTTKGDLEMHQQACLGFKKVGQVFKCLHCNTQINQLKDMVLHASILHAEGNTDVVASGNSCSVCGKTYSTSKHLKAHMQSHANKSFACPVCEWQSNNARKFNQHMRSHDEDKIVQNSTHSKKRDHILGKRKYKTGNDYLPEKYTTNNKKVSKPNMEKVVQLNSGMRLRPRKQLKPSVYVDDAQWETEDCPDLQYECNNCERAFTSTEYLQNHKRITHVGQNPYICLICKRRFSDEALFKLHRDMHNETFQCTFCKASFDKLELLHNHDQVHGSDKPSCKCSECPAVFPDGKSLYRHVQTHTTEGSRTLQQKKATTQGPNRVRPSIKLTRYHCNECDKTFSSQSALKTHEKSHKSDTIYPCKYCSKEFKFASDHKIHESLHEEYDGLAVDAHKYKCKYCRKGLQHKTDLKLHEALHEAHGRKDFPCDQCDKVFKHRLEMKQHRRNHFRDKLPKPTKCPDCDKKFSWGTQLREHKKTHWTEKPHLCVYCRVRFKTQEELSQHEPIHTQNKRHQCQICQRKFKDKAHIRDHMLIHTGEKPFPCRYCAKAFRQLGQRRTHERVHTREAPFICDICNRAFIYWTSLRVHKKSHYKGKPPEEVEKLIRTTKIITKKKTPPSKTNNQETVAVTQTESQQVAVDPQPQQVSAIVSTNLHQQNQETSNHELPSAAVPQNIHPPAQQNIRQNMNVPIHLTIQSNEQQMTSVDHMTSQMQRPDEMHQPAAQEAHWEQLHTRYLNTPQTWQPPPNWQGLPTTQPMQSHTNWEMPPGNWAGPPPAHQSHASASSIITSALYGIMQRDNNDGRGGYQQ